MNEPLRPQLLSLYLVFSIFSFNFVSLFHKQLKELLALLLHVLLVLVDEDWFHYQFVESVEILCAASMHSLLLVGSLFVWVKDSLVGAV